MANICIDCKKACGGCSWSEIDPKTKKVRFQPVEGWTATKRVLYLGISRGTRRWAETYDIKACPLFESDAPDKPKPALLPPNIRKCNICGKEFEGLHGRMKYCYDCVPPGFVVKDDKIVKRWKKPKKKSKRGATHDQRR